MKRKSFIMFFAVIMLFTLVITTSTACKKNHAHTYSEEWSVDENNHWHAATCKHTDEKKDFEAHSWNEGVVTKEATETEEGEKTFTCTVCNKTKKEYIPILEHKHTYSEEWTADENNHWHAATCKHTDQKKDFEAHSWNEGVVTKEATETEKGEKTFTCTVCNKTKKVDLDPLGVEHKHTYSEEWSVDENNHWHAATCEHVDEKKDLEAHSWNEGVVTKEATETEEGEKTFTCTVCNKTKLEYIPTLEHKHTYSEEWTADENNHWHAATCKHTDEKKDLEAHSWNDGVLDIDPDYGEEGSTLYTCKVCGKTKSEPIPPLTPFFMPIIDKFNVSGKGVLISGIITSGTVTVGDKLSISGIKNNVTVISIEKFKKEYETATEGEEVGILISGITKEEIGKNSCIYTPSTKQAYNQFTLDLTLLTNEEGGRKAPIFSKYSSTISLYPYEKDGITSYVGEIKGYIYLPDNLEMFMPGETHEVTVVLGSPIILESGMKVAIKEGSKIIGSGIVTSTSEHEHDENYETYGKCDICKLSQTIVLESDEYGRYSYSTNLEVNGRIYLEINPNYSGVDYWRVDVEGAKENIDFELEIYDEKGNDITKTGDIERGKTYYVVIVCMNNVNDVKIFIHDHNDM